MYRRFISVKILKDGMEREYPWDGDWSDGMEREYPWDGDWSDGLEREYPWDGDWSDGLEREYPWDGDWSDGLQLDQPPKFESTQIVLKNRRTPRLRTLIWKHLGDIN